MASLVFPVPLGILPTPAAGTFRSLFREFDTAPDELIQGHLDQAALRIDPRVWGALAGQGQAYLAAHLLATSPLGLFARLVAKDGETIYSRTHKDLASVATAFVMRVV